MHTKRLLIGSAMSLAAALSVSTASASPVNTITSPAVAVTAPLLGPQLANYPVGWSKTYPNGWGEIGITPAKTAGIEGILLGPQLAEKPNENDQKQPIIKIDRFNRHLFAGFSQVDKKKNFS